MKRYVHNPDLFRDHFVGQGLDVFKGARMQRGGGNFMGKFKRFAVPLLLAGARAAAPQISNLAKTVTSAAAQRVFPNSPAFQNFAGKLASNVTNQVLKKSGKVQKKRKPLQKLKRAAKARRLTPPNIFQ